MKKRLIYILPFILLLACSENRESSNYPSSLFPKRKTTKLNTKHGYILNSLSGDTIQPIVLESGDTLATGVSIAAKGKKINSDGFAKPQRFKIPKKSQLTTKKAYLNKHKITSKLNFIPVNHDSLTTVLLEAITKTDTAHYLINSTSDTVKTGVPIPVKGKKVTFTQAKITKALPPRFKDSSVKDIQYLDVDQGMPSSYILYMLEDKRGNIWFCTHGGGVSCYDGESFVHYTEKEGLSNNTVYYMLEDKSGNLWFATYDGGVSCYDGESFFHFTEKEGLSRNKVYSMLEDKDGNLWFGTYGGGVSRYDGESFVHYTEKEGLSSNKIYSMYEDSHGDLWFGTHGGGVSRYDGKRFVNYTEKEGLSSNIVLSILEDKNGNMWFGTYGGGASFYDGKSFVNYTEKEGLSNNIVYAILEDKSGDLWFGTHGGGVTHYNGRSFIHYTKKEGLSNDIVSYILEDNSGDLWFGTFGGGVSRYNVASFSYYTQKEGLSNNVVLSMLEDKNGNLWFGTNGGGVNCYDGKSFVHYTHKEGLSNNIVLSIFEDKNENLWFGTLGGASCYNGKEFVNYTKKEGLSNNTVYSILEDKNGNLWFGTDGGGVNFYDGENFVHYTEKEGLSNNIVYSMLEDKSGNIWFGTDGGGVSCYDGENFINYTEKEGLSDNHVSSILEDKYGNLWFGTEGGGVNCYDGESFVHYTEKEGLSNNSVYSILEDKSGNLWFGTEFGLNELVRAEGIAITSLQNAKKTEKDTLKILQYLKNDGLKGLDFYSATLIDSKNRAWWGSGKSLTMLDLNNHTITQKPPKIYLKQIDINEQFIDYRNLADSLKNEIVFSDVQLFKNNPVNLKLSHTKNHLTFHYVAIDWSAPHKIKYSYRLKGFNSKWSKPSTETKANYQNLPYGTFTFEAKAIGALQEWSDSFYYTFTINKPWWHTWWARILYVLSSLLLIFCFVQWRIKQLKERQKELEIEVDKATKDLKEQKEVIERAHKNITDSIYYAEQIQRSFLATEEILNENLNEYFVYFNPKDVVSGDFYWAAKLSNGNFAMVNADSTGHGVPGAIMSILNISAIEKAIEKGATCPAEIFNQTRKTIIERLKNDGTEEGGSDGMAASLISFNSNKSKMAYVAAQNPIWIIRDNKLIEIKPEKMPLAKHAKEHIPFIGGECNIQKGDRIYTLTDGFQDQFGGARNKKFMVKRMREYILSISNLTMAEQHQRLNETFSNWKGDTEQIDDVCVIGVKI